MLLPDGRVAAPRLLLKNVPTNDLAVIAALFGADRVVCAVPDRVLDLDRHGALAALVPVGQSLRVGLAADGGARYIAAPVVGGWLVLVVLTSAPWFFGQWRRFAAAGSAADSRAVERNSFRSTDAERMNSVLLRTPDPCPTRITQFLTEGQQAGARYCLAAPRRAPQGTAGSQLGRLAGESMEFMDHREYQPGDDLRRLDWAPTPAATR